MDRVAILAVNMRRRNAATHALLETNSTDDILCSQEPWFSRIGVTRADDAREGRDVLGGAAHPNWTIHYPYFTTSQRAKVMTYTRKFTRTHGRKQTPIRTVTRLDLARHPTLLITDHHVNKDCLRIINFYHDVDDPSSFRALTSLDLDPEVPTILVGDFNMHSPSWSPEGWTRSPRSDPFERWAAGQTMELQTGKGDVTRRGREEERPSTLDLTWHNLAASLTLTLTPPTLDWEASLGSDHAGIRTQWLLEARPTLTHLRPLRTYKLDIGPEEKRKWADTIALALPPLWEDLSSPTLIDDAARSLQAAVETACSKHMTHKKAPGARPNQWWSQECTDAVQTVRNAIAEDDENKRQDAQRSLRKVVKATKRSWADKLVTSGAVWEVAKWRHGRKSSTIAALRNDHGELTFDHEDVADLLARRFFTTDPGNVPLQQHDDPPPRSKRVFPPISGKEVQTCLNGTSNSSAAGESGISWEILKMAWPSLKDHFLKLANACISTGYHPIEWRKALVVVIPKLGKDDYSMAKSYRPISLLECLSKLIEKVMSKRFLYDVDKYALIPTTQFGTRAFSCTTDAGITLVHDVEHALRNGKKCAALLFDIKGFFDNVHKDRLAATIENLGFSEGVKSWALSFLSARRVRMTFNGITSTEQEQSVGTPQGSPVSPVLSAIYTSPLLSINPTENTTLGMYVDDGVIFAQGDDWDTVNERLTARYQVCEEWLRRNNLAVEPEKTELVYFRKPWSRQALPPDRLYLPDPTRSTYYRVSPKTTVRYLGFLINQKLDWEPHVTTMCNRARASIKALKVLGNTHRGLSMANWRLVFNAVCLPVLAHGCQLWATSRKYASLIKKMQLVFNEGVKVISGAFRTAPREALHELTRVLPARLFFDKLTQTSALRLYRIPPTSQLFPRLGGDWQEVVTGRTVSRTTPQSKSNQRAQRPTALEALGARVPADGPRANVVAIPPWEVPIWEAHLNSMEVARPQDRKKWVDDLYENLPASGAVILNVAGTISNKGRFDDLMVGGSAATLTSWEDGEPWNRTKRWGLGTGVVQNDVAMFGIAKAAEWLNQTYADRPPPSHAYILCTNSSALQGITKVSSYDNQNSVLLFHHALTSFCSQHREVGITLVWSPVQRERSQDTTTRAKAMEACTHTPRASLNRVQSAAYQKQATRKRAFDKWAEEWHAERRKRYGKDSFAYEYALTKPPSGHNHPLWKAAVDKTDGVPCFSRHTTTTALRLAVGHAFISDYSRRFRPDIPEEENRCLCGFPDHSFHHLLYDCPRHTQARLMAGGQRQWDDESPLYYFRDFHSSRQLLDFLQISRAAFLPVQRAAAPFDPG